MFLHQGIWFPDGEKHFPEWMDKNREIVCGRGTYQIRKLRAAMTHVREFRTAVDVGGHVGLWAMHLSERFAEVHAFEPMKQMQECFERNMDCINNVMLYKCALADKPGRAVMKYNPADTGNTHVGEFTEDVTKTDHGVPVMTLDEFDLQHVDFIKIDCEGFEEMVLRGAKDTIMRCRPALCVEQKPHKLKQNYDIKGIPAINLLRSWGATIRQEISGDYIMTF